MERLRPAAGLEEHLVLHVQAAAVAVTRFLESALLT
jgi:hypothetical protein